MTVASPAAMDRGSAADEGLAVLRGAVTAHGRRPFTGARRVLVAMGNPYLAAPDRRETDQRA